ncbi:hypothetical protein DIPPA_03438 [Diplonema papillatum]|nr:hypothetical protein DIPPA_03438 [Diplonema papillatum]
MSAIRATGYADLRVYGPRQSGQFLLMLRFCRAHALQNTWPHGSATGSVNKNVHTLHFRHVFKSSRSCVVTPVSAGSCENADIARFRPEGRFPR